MTKLAPARDRRPDDGRVVPRRRRSATSSAAASRRSTRRWPLPNLFGVVAAFGIVLGIVLLALSRPIKAWMGGG